MSKLLIFDLDGTLVDTTELHNQSFFKAMKSVNREITQEQFEQLDGLPTKKKIDILNLPIEFFDIKNQFFQELIADYNNPFIKKLFSFLKTQGHKICICSNASRVTVNLLIDKLDISHLLEKSYSSEDVQLCKPSPEIYLKCLNDFPNNEAIIFEDSPLGIKSALASNTTTRVINHPNELNFEILNRKTTYDLNVVIPMAGESSRFGGIPKPFIDIHGKPMLQRVLESISIDANYIFIAKKGFREKINNIKKGTIVEVEKTTEGAACTILLAEQYIHDKPLLIVNSDQCFEVDMIDFLYKAYKTDGSLLTFEATDKKWSFVKEINEKIIQVAEKQPISNIATVGGYYWKNGSDFIKYANQMINKNIRVNNEFYVAPVYNEAILDKKCIKKYDVQKMIPLGTPEDLEANKDYFSL